MGFILLLLVLQPLKGFVDGGISITDLFTGVIPMQNEFPADAIYEHLHNTHLRAAFELQLTAQLEGLLAQNDFTLHSASFEYTDDFSRITHVQVSVSRPEVQRRVPFIRIEPVRVGEADNETPNPSAIEVKNLIAGFYNLAVEHIHVIIIPT